jgi:serine/threonine protein kinase
MNKGHDKDSGKEKPSKGPLSSKPSKKVEAVKKSSTSSIMGRVLADKFRIVRQLGGGSFGKVFIAEDIEEQPGQKGPRCYAVKVEKVYGKRNTIRRELDVYTSAGSKIENIPRVHMWCKGDNHKDESGKYYFHQYLVMELLGPSIFKLYEKAGKQLPWSLVAPIGIQIIKLLEQLHGEGFVHRDIKPDNFVMGLGERKGIVHMIDFGLSRRWEDLIDKYTQNDETNSSSSVVGTARYMSINVHNGLVYGWRDDLESLGYVLIFLYCGKLPWQGVKGETKHMQMRMILNKKIDAKANPRKIFPKNLPSQLERYMQYCWNLDLETQPDYSYLRGLFRESAEDDN